MVEKKIPGNYLFFVVHCKNKSLTKVKDSCITQSDSGAGSLAVFLKILEIMETRERFGHVSHQF